MRVEAPIKVDRKTKKLAKRLSAGEIAVINHIDILLPPTFIEDISGINITVTTDSKGNDVIIFD